MHESDDAEQRPAWAWIDQAALRHNARCALGCAAGRTVIGVVKADGYGHGASDVAHALLAEGVKRLAVVSVAEGAALRHAGIVAPILLMGGLDDAASAERAVKWGLTPVLQDRQGVALARRFGRRGAAVSVEVEVDTGMRRMGVPEQDAVALLAEIESCPELSLSGVFTHLARADEPDPAPSLEQQAKLVRLLGAFEAQGGPRPDVHVANSAGLLRIAELEGKRRGQGPRTQAVRPGLMLYGVSPFDRGRPAGTEDSDAPNGSALAFGLEPVMTLAARVVSVRRIAKGDAVGYGGEWRAARATTIATLPLGYADGLPRSLWRRPTADAPDLPRPSAGIHLAGARRPIVGRVSMDSVCLDVGDADVAVGDVATVFGRTPEGAYVPVEQLAAAAGTIAYEILVGIGARVPRRLAQGPPPALENAARAGDGEGGRAL